MASMTRASRAGVLALAALFGTSACQSAPAATPTAETTSAAATPEATANASPSAAPVDVVALFKAKAGSFKSGGVMTFKGTATIGLVQVSLNGNITYAGVDNRTLVTSTIGGVDVQVEQVQVAGKRYSRTGTGPWLEMAIPSGSSGLSGQLAASALATLHDEGVEEHNGDSLHKLVVSSDAGFDPSSLLSSVSGAENMQLDIAYFVGDDGTPVAATIDATWTQKAGEQSVAGSMRFDMTFSHLGQTQTVRIPPDVWAVFSSARYHFTLAHPADWTFFKAKGADELDAPYYAYVLASRQKAEGANLNQWGKAQVAAMKAFLGGKPVSNEDASLGGVGARFLSGTGKAKDLGGKNVIAYEAVAVKGGFVYVVLWVSEVGAEANDRILFEQMLSTFQFA
jgi:hypothetical protein